MSTKPVIEDINEFLDYNNKSRAEFIAAIGNLEIAISECITKRNFIEAYKLARLQAKFQKLYFKKIAHDDKEEIKSFRGKH